MTKAGSIIAEPITLSGENAWGLRQEALRCAVLVISTFGKMMSSHVPALLLQCWGLFKQSLDPYEQCMVLDEGDLSETEEDNEGNTTSFETVIAQLFEALLAVADSARFQHLLRPVLPELIHTTIGYMQMTSLQESTWTEDAEQYVADEEEETFSARASGELLLDSILTAFHLDACRGLAQASHSHLQHADHLKQSSQEHWWRPREAAILAIGCVSPILKDLHSADPSSCPFDFQALLDSIQQMDLSQSALHYPFLIGRALWAVSRLCQTIPADHTARFLPPACAALTCEAPAVHIGACRAVASLCKHCKSTALQQHLPALHQGLLQLLNTTGEETLHLALECLTAVIKADPSAAAALEPQLSPKLLTLWSEHVHDPLLSIDAVEAIDALAKVPGVLPNLQERAVPTLVSLLQDPGKLADGLVSGAIDLVSTLLAPSTLQQAQRMHQALTCHVISLAEHSDDAEVIRSCCTYLRILVRSAQADLLHWESDRAESTLQLLLGMVSHYLQPSLPDAQCYAIGQLLSAMLRHLREAMMDAVPQLITKLAVKLCSAQSLPLIMSLLVALAQLVLLDAKTVVDILAASSIPGKDGNALQLILNLWTERHGELTGVYAINISIVAIALLLALQHPQVISTQVKGWQIETDTGIRTRSKARKQQEQWVMLPAPVKLFSLLVDTVGEQQEGGGPGFNGRQAGDDEDEEWEDASDGGLHSNLGSLGPGLEDVFAHNLDDDDDLEDDTDVQQDPITSMDILHFVAEQLKAFSAAHPDQFGACCSQLGSDRLRPLKHLYPSA
ncbi:hypothetical protein WJX84_000998 [Apatococcus fuscideae]